MKKTKALLVAASMLTAASANAAWDTGATFETGNGEFILSAWDSVRQLSYTQDLGIRFDQASASNIIPVDATAFSVFGGDFNGVSWNVAAASNFNNSFSDFSNHGFMVSGGASYPPPGDITAFGGAFSKFNSHAATIGATIGNAADNDTYVATSNTDNTWAGEPAWGDSFGQVLANGTIGAAGDLLNLHWLNLDPTTFAGTSSVVGNVQFDMANGQIVFNGGAPNPIPVPAAAWLLVSGLAGLGAVARRRKS